MTSSSRVRALLREHLVEAALLACLGPLAIYYYLAEDPPEPINLSPLEERTVLQMQTVVVRDYQENLHRWTLNGAKASVAEDASVMEVTQPVLQLHNRPDAPPAPETRILADTGLIDWQRQRVEVQGNVRVLRENKLHLQAERAIYDLRSEVLRMPGAVQGAWQGSQVEGADLRYELDTEQLELRQVTYQR
jgi:LPS export ABC transporter protein LptC